MSAPPQQPEQLLPEQLRVRSCRPTAGGGLAGPTNNDVCLNGGGAALTLYTPCQFPPVRQPVNCCHNSIARISSQRLTGFLYLRLAVTSWVKAFFGLFDTCQWLGGSCHQICQIEPKLAPDSWSAGFWQVSSDSDNCQRLSPVVVKWLWAVEKCQKICWRWKLLAWIRGSDTWDL